MAKLARHWNSKSVPPQNGDRPQPGGFSEVGLEPRVADRQFHLASARAEKLKERGFSNDEVYKIVAPRRTLARRKELGQDLTAPESDRVLRLERISDMADRVFADKEKARRWLRKHSRGLDGARPIELLESETGAHLVEQELHRLDYGMLA